MTLWDMGGMMEMEEEEEEEEDKQRSPRENSKSPASLIDLRMRPISGSQSRLAVTPLLTVHQAW